MIKRLVQVINSTVSFRNALQLDTDRVENFNRLWKQRHNLYIDMKSIRCIHRYHSVEKKQ